MSEPVSRALHVEFDRATVELDAVQRAVYALADVMTVDISAVGAKYDCTVFPRSGAALDDDLGHALRAEVNDQTLRLRIAGQTEQIRSLIFALAFSQTGLVDDGAEQ